jgi:hypothetical protein
MEQNVFSVRTILVTFPEEPVPVSLQSTALASSDKSAVRTGNKWQMTLIFLKLFLIVP